MPGLFLLRTAIGAVIVALHLPMIYFTHTLHARLAPGQGIGDLGPLAMLALLFLAILPYAMLALFRIDWNPERARLGEYDC